MVLILIEVKKSDGKYVKLKLNYNELNGLTESLNWSYLFNPLDDSSYIIKKISNRNIFTYDILDIIKNNRYSDVYINSINNA